VATSINACLIDWIDLAPMTDDTASSGFSPRMTHPKLRRSSGKEKAANDKLNFNRDNSAFRATKPRPLRLG
jgi:hypothetical protein